MKTTGVLGVLFVVVLVAVALLTNDAPCQSGRAADGWHGTLASPYGDPLLGEVGWRKRIVWPYGGPLLGEVSGGRKYPSPYMGLFSDDRGHSLVSGPDVSPSRYEITVVRKRAILLDKMTGETWILVFTESEKAPAYWQPIPKKDSSALDQDRKKENANRKSRAG
jgi:hypothetical protein